MGTIDIEGAWKKNRRGEKLRGAMETGAVVGFALGASAVVMAVEGSSAVSERLRSRLSGVRDTIRSFGEQVLTIGQTEFRPANQPDGMIQEVYMPSEHGAGYLLPVIEAPGVEQS